MSNKITKRTLIVVLLAYVALGIIAGVILYRNGTFSKKDDSITYNFEEDESTGLDIPDVSINSVASAGEPHKVEKPEDLEFYEEPSESSEQTKEYYSFIVNTKVQRLMIRQDPNLLSPILAKMPKGTPGYVLEYGEDWCLVTDGTNQGYSATRYLSLTNLDPDNLPSDYPEEYR